MIESFIHTTENNNLYVHDDQQRLSMLVHPEFEKAYEKSNDADLYYLKKYTYLRDHGFFAKPKLANFGTVDESMVKESIVQSQQIVFETVDYCNLKCTYCGFGELYKGFDARNRKKMDARYAKKILKYIFELKPQNKKSRLSIGFYGGEPLLNMDFIKRIVEFTNQLNNERGLELVYSMTTNATLIHKCIDFLVANKFNLHISLDGNEKNHSYRIYNKNHKNSFQKVIENVDMIQRDYPEYFSAHITFAAVLHNRSSIKEINEFIYVRYKKIPIVSELSMDDINPDKKDLLERMYHSKRKSEIEFRTEQSNLLHTIHGELTAFKELTDFLRYYSVNFYISNILASLHNIEKYLPASTCLPFLKRIYFTIHHKLLPCEKINYAYSIGKVNKKVEINIPEIVRQYNFYYDHLKKICQSCYAYRFCGTCLFQIKNIEHCDSEEIVCDRFYDQKAFKNKLFRIFSFLEKYPNDFSQIVENVIVE
ncbi:radical SAM peptide maturase [Bacteroidia bacterium]|nr:radical SAM peptide maturase [Bacteroidia bacterium]